jgi:hypothetical protein
MHEYIDLLERMRLPAHLAACGRNDLVERLGTSVQSIDFHVALHNYAQLQGEFEHLHSLVMEIKTALQKN